MTCCLCHCFLTFFPWFCVGSLLWKTKFHKLLTEPLPMGSGWLNMGPFPVVQSAPVWFLYKLRSSARKPGPVWAPFLGDPGPGRNLLQRRLPTGSQSVRHTHAPGSTVSSSMDCRWISAPLGPPWAGFKCDWNNNIPTCPGFSWDRIHFLPSSWNSVVFGIYYENNVDNTMMVLVLPQQHLP